MLMLIAGGSFVAGSDNPHHGTSMPLGPSTLYHLETSGGREHKLARRVSSLGATTVHLVLRAP